MKIVIDTSVVIAVISNEKHKHILVKKTMGAHLIAPSSMQFEVGNAISAMFRRNRINLEQAHVALKAFEKIPIQVYNTNLMKSIEIAQSLGIYAHDAYFLECAQTNKCPLISLDYELMMSATKLGIKSIEV
jgi:predicted nucleic acid-binding protein